MNHLKTLNYKTDAIQLKEDVAMDGKITLDIVMILEQINVDINKYIICSRDNLDENQCEFSLPTLSYR